MKRIILMAATLLAASCAAPPTPPPAPPAPVVPPPAVDVSDCRSCHAGGSSVYPDAANVYEHWESSGHGQFLRRRNYRPECTSCHDLAGAAGQGHLDGKANAAGPNVYHLVEGYILADPASEWDVQVRFDEQCWTACHKPAGVKDMRHERDGDPVPGAVQMGQHLSFSRTADLEYLMDGDLTLTEFTKEPPHFAPCVACHDPHGTGSTDTTRGTNKMVRDNYRNPPLLCTRCH